MIKQLTIRTSIIMVMVFAMIAAKADVPTWNIIPSQSTVSFTAIQNNAPVSGSFKSFTGDIHFAPQQLDQSNVRIEIDINSLTTADIQIIDTLRSVDWFNAKAFPKAIFTANKFIKTADGKYQAEGNLTIRDKTQPVTLLFTLKETPPNQMTAQGTTVLKRSMFGVGQGDWSNTNEIKDNVNVEFTLAATKK